MAAFARLSTPQGLIFVIDSNDGARIAEARDELHKVLFDDALRGVNVLVLANKSDLPHSMGVAEVTEKLGLHSLKQRSWFVQSCCAVSAEGLFEGLDWLSTHIG
eukprot:jgi/Mesen1/4155/ME000219S03290